MIKLLSIICQKEKLIRAHCKYARDGSTLLVRPSRIPHRISKILFALGANEFLAILEGKIRVAPCFKVQSGKITVWPSDTK